MTRSCFGELGGVKSCWGYKLKVVRSEEETKDTFLNNVRLFSLKELQKATNNFSTLLGKGGFSSYYKGTLEDGTVVTMLIHRKGSVNEKRGSDFTSLINVMFRIRHRNVVELIGICLEGDCMIFVYEFAGDDHLDQLFVGSSDTKLSWINWPTRASICIGIARGLEYLQEGVNHRVLHRDIKPSNIVLDSNFNPKIAEFGVAQLFDDDEFQYSGPLDGGSYVYTDPEYKITGRCTEKVDVYSFGIILLEVISGRRGHDFQRDGSGVTLVGWVWELRQTDRIREIVDPTLFDFPMDEMIRFIDAALSCVQYSSNLRPNISEVLLMLLGSYDFSKRILRNPEQSLQSGNYDEVSIPSHDRIASIHESGMKQDFLVSGSTFRKALSQPTTKSMSKTTRGGEMEIESDVDTHSTASEVMEISHDLETELHQSVEGNICDAAYVPEPSDKIALKSQLDCPSLIRVGNPSTASTEIHVHEDAIEVAEDSQMSYDLEAEIQMSEPSFSEILFGQTSVKADVRASSSAENKSLIQNEAVDRISLQAVISRTEDVLSLPKVNLNRSIHCTIEKILEAFQDARHCRIGLYGCGGSGKTTVLKNLLFHSVTKELFDQVLFVTVPRFSPKKHVQDEIVRQLSLNVKESCSENEILCLVHQALIDRKYLLLLDDVWESMNLHEVGIPNPGPENSCWLLLATRSLDVCHVMADKEIEMEVLSDVEAWALFYGQVGDIVDSPEIKPYAQAISKECYGSSVIISAIGSALRAESNVEEWKLALRNLQLGDTANKNDPCFFKKHIKYCYDRLKAHNVKKCFLYIALFQEDKQIDISSLVECFISEGLVGGTTVAAYEKGYDIVGQLTNASLLEANVNDLMVKMHNVVRDSALEILSSDIEGYRVLARLPESEDEDHPFQESSWATNLVDKFNSSNIQLPSMQKYLTRAGAHLKESPSVEEWEQATMIFLMDNELSSLPIKPSCSSLVALLLQRNSCLRVIPASFFDSMFTLRILNLSKTRIKSLPESFSRLRSLQILLMCDCERLLVLPPSIGLLKFLEVLDLQGTELTHLPDSVGELANLKQLRVSFYGSMNHSEYNKLPSKLISDKIISSLRPSLRELGMFVYPGDRRWIFSASSITEEISNLMLSGLYFYFPKVENLDSFVHASQSWKDRYLTTFNFVVGHDFKRVVSLESNDVEVLYSEGQRCLRYVNGDSIPDVVVEVLTRTTTFYLDHHLSICYLSQFGIDCFDDLKICILRDCPELLGIVNSQEHGRKYLPVLEYLSLNYLWNLKRIWVGHAAMGSLAGLRCLSVHACPKLSYILTSSMLKILPNLEELVVEDCVSLEYVVIEDEDDKVIMHGDVDSVSVKENAVGFLVLRSLKVLKLHYLPEICGIWTARWPPLEYISFYDCPKLRNLHMEGNDDVHIKEVAADKLWWDSLEWDDLELSSRLHKHVTKLHIDQL